MRSHSLFYAFLSLPLLLLGSGVCFAKNWVVSVGGTSTYGDGYGGSYTTAVLAFQPMPISPSCRRHRYVQRPRRRCAQCACGRQFVPLRERLRRRGGDGTPSSANWSSTVTFNTPGLVSFHCDNHQTWAWSEASPSMRFAGALHHQEFRQRPLVQRRPKRPWFPYPDLSAEHFRGVLVRLQPGRQSGSVDRWPGNV